MMTAPPPAIPRRWMAGLLDASSPRAQGQALTLVAGAVPAPGRRTVASALRVTGLAEAPTFTSHHRALDRNGWSSRELARRLLRPPARRLVPEGPIIAGLDGTPERRRGARIEAKGIHRDPARSSRGHFAKASGLRRPPLALLAPVPYASRVWALPFLTVLAARYRQERGRRHRTLLDRGRQTLPRPRRWPPGGRIVAVTDAGLAALELHGAVRRQVDAIARRRLDANLLAPPPSWTRSAPNWRK
jgi:DDE superfamily endonuclease